MTNEERNELRTALKEVHDRVHKLYPEEAGGGELRHRLLVIDLCVHLADEVIAAPEADAAKVVERTANLLYAVRLLAPGHELGKAAELLLATPELEARSRR